MRSRRVATNISKSTSRDLGPGKYDVEKKPFSPTSISYAPFSSSSLRRMDPVGENISPGPGEYHFDFVVSPSSAGASTKNFISKAPRFERVVKNENPGPGAYSEKSEWVKRNSRPRKQRHGTVQFVKSKQAPSIPSTEQSYGYEETTTGELFLQPPPVKGYTGRANDTVGVGAYEPYKSMGSDTPGFNFGKRSVRDLGSHVPKVTSPGPGQYYIDESTPTNKNNRQTANFKSTKKRWGTDTTQAATPGPGHYRVDHTSFKKSTIRTRLMASKTQILNRIRTSYRRRSILHFCGTLSHISCIHLHLTPTNRSNYRPRAPVFPEP